MKKNIVSAFALLAACATLASCGSSGEAVNKETLEKAANTAASQVGVAYTDFAGSKGISMGGTKLLTTQTVDDYTFSFEYSFTPVENYAIEYMKLEGDIVKVEVPTFDELKDYSTKTFAGYKLNAVVKYAEYAGENTDPFKDLIGTQITTKTYNFKVNAEETKPVWKKISEAREVEKDKTVVTSGYVVAFMNNENSGEFKNGVWIADGADGLMLYGGSLGGMFEKLHIGDYVFIVGPSSPYNGLMEVKPDSVSIDYDTTRGVQQPVFTETDEARYNSLTNVNANDPVLVKGLTFDASKLKDAENGKASSVTFTLGNTKVTYHMNKHTEQSMRQEVIDLLKANAGKKVNLKTIGGTFDGKFQLSGVQLSDHGGITECFEFVA